VGRPSIEQDRIGELDKTVIVADHVSKKFCNNLRRSMAHGITDLAKNIVGIKPETDTLRKNEFWAVDDVSFRLKKGEVLGLIGLNGSGKSSLLRLVSGILPPDKGCICIRGRVGALIAIGAGFHPHMTGRENIFLNGTILGMTRSEIKAKYQEIVDFAQIDEFIDAPVATYSSGMRVRLGFSVAVHMDPDLMLIDEVLAVGDFSFRQKCSERINDIRSRTATILVSHNMRDIMMLCSKAMVLNNGRVAFQGDPKEAIAYYLNTAASYDTAVGDGLQDNRNKKMNLRSFKSEYGEIYHNKQKISDICHQWIGQDKKPVEFLTHRSTVFLEFSFKLLTPISRLVVGVPIFNSEGIMITGMSTDMDSVKVKVLKDGWVRGRLTIDGLNMNPGQYFSYIAIMDNKEFIYRNAIGRIDVQAMSFYFGIFTPKYHWDFEEMLLQNTNQISIG
jgi:lipopolysaccharide transport system ATP-binding protein